MPVDIRKPFEKYENDGLLCLDPSLAHQSFRDECDFNNVLSKWQNSGLITHLNPQQPIYADVSNLGDYQQSMELIRSAHESFEALPSSIRDRFNNDPAQLMAFLQDSSNFDEAVKLGLLSPRAPAVDKSVGTQSPEPTLSTASTAGA